MTLWVCAGPEGCGTKYAVGLFRCPRCHNTEFFEDGDPMAKITRHGGASDKTLPVPESADAAPEPQAEAAPAPEPVDVTEHLAATPEPVVEGGEESSPGSSSSASTGPQPTNSEPNEKPRRKPARKTASRSVKDQTESGSAPSTAGAKTDESSTDGSGE